MTGKSFRLEDLSISGFLGEIPNRFGKEVRTWSLAGGPPSINLVLSLGHDPIYAEIHQETVNLRRQWSQEADKPLTLDPLGLTVAGYWLGEPANAKEILDLIPKDQGPALLARLTDLFAIHQPRTERGTIDDFNAVAQAVLDGHGGYISADTYVGSSDDGKPRIGTDITSNLVLDALSDIIQWYRPVGSYPEREDRLHLRRPVSIRFDSVQPTSHSRLKAVEALTEFYDRAAADLGRTQRQVANRLKTFT